MFSSAVPIEGVHPLQFGFVRRKVRTQRRHGMRIVNPILFYPWRIYDAVHVTGQWVMKALHYRRILKRVVSNSAPHAWFDQAMQPSSAEGGDHLVDAFADKIPKDSRCTCLRHGAGNSRGPVNHGKVTLPSGGFARIVAGDHLPRMSSVGSTDVQTTLSNVRSWVSSGRRPNSAHAI